jgi:2-C-methyl-D-erythritol 4-phosphate cytidylyltransferase
MRTVAVVLAGGSGERFGGGVPKQLLTLRGRTLLEHSVAAFERAPCVDAILVVCAAAHAERAGELLAAGGFGKLAKVITGGVTRVDSTRAAIDELSSGARGARPAGPGEPGSGGPGSGGPSSGKLGSEGPGSGEPGSGGPGSGESGSGEPGSGGPGSGESGSGEAGSGELGWAGAGAGAGSGDCDVLFHDAARPLVDQETIAACAAALADCRAVGVCVPSSDTIAVVSDGVMTSMPRRDSLVRCQTPQGFRLSVIRRAHELAAADPAFADLPATDDCGIVLRYLPGVAVRIVPGSDRNIKITYPRDLDIAETLMKE